MSTSRLRSPAPPPPSLPPKQDLTARNSTSYLNIDFSNPPPIVLDEDQKLAAALRDTVRISPRPKSTLLPENSSAYHSSNHTGGSRGKYTYSQSIPDLVSLGKPQLPSARMAEQNKNPFEEDEVEPSGTGRVGPPKLAGTTTVTSRGIENTATTQPSRQKYNRTLSSNTTTTSSSANLLAPASPERSKMRTRRSLSSDSYGLDAGQKEVAAGQRKTAEDKKASRHADVIDTWDPTGLGSAMWHHSGPYDAAAPSRNTNLPPSKAPMRAFNGAPVQSPPRGPTTISLSSPPVPPSKDLPEGNGHKRAQSAMRAQATRRQSGGLTGQYSTSMPASGGYFPDPDEGTDDASTARRDRQKQRDDKRRALKAAWGTDIPEPFEDFGGSPLGDEMDLTDDMYSPESQTAQLPGRPMRSPGLRMGLGARTPSIKEESSSPTGDFPPQTTYSRGVAQPLPGGGVKRTKSLMQKFKTMVRTRSGSVESQPAVPSVYGRSADRSHSISAGGQRPAISPGIGRPEGQAVVEEELMDEMDDDNQFADAREDVFGTATEMGQWQGSRGERRAMSEGRRR